MALITSDCGLYSRTRALMALITSDRGYIIHRVRREVGQDGQRAQGRARLGGDLGPGAARPYALQCMHTACACSVCIQCMPTACAYSLCLQRVLTADAYSVCLQLVPTA